MQHDLKERKYVNRHTTIIAWRCGTRILMHLIEQYEKQVYKVSIKAKYLISRAKQNAEFHEKSRIMKYFINICEGRKASLFIFCMQTNIGIYPKPRQKNSFQIVFLLCKEYILKIVYYRVHVGIVIGFICISF